MIGLLLAAFITACPASTEIHCNETMTGVLDASCPSREFAWDATAGTFLDAFLRVQGFAPKFTLIGPDGVEIKSVRTIGGGRMIHDVLVSGRYRLVVAARENDVPNGPFTIDLFCNTVCRAPTFVTQPMNTAVDRGQRATLTALAVSPYPFEYLWFDATAPQTPVATGATFITPPLEASAVYNLIARNQCGSMPAQQIVVTVRSDLRRRPSH